MSDAMEKGSHEDLTLFQAAATASLEVKLTKNRSISMYVWRPLLTTIRTEHFQSIMKVMRKKLSWF